MNPDEIFPLHGVVTSVDPVEGQVVRLLRDVQRFEPFQNQQCDSSRGTLFKETPVDAGGNFGFEVFRVEAQSLAGYDSYCFRVETTFPSGSSSWTDPGGLGSGPSLQPLRDWRASPRVEGGVLHFEPPVPWPDDAPPAQGPDGQWHFGTQLGHRAEVDTDDGGIVWVAGDLFQPTDGGLGSKRESIVLDDARLEDFSATLTLSASLSEPDQIPYGLLSSQSSPPVQMRAGEQLSLLGVRTPLSRGLPCLEVATPCPLTDGDLTAVDAGMINEVTLELATPALLSSAVLRGAVIGGRKIRVVLTQGDGGVAMEVEPTVPLSAIYDSTEWLPSSFIQLPDGGYTALNLVYLVIPLDAGVPIHRVTLQFPEGLARIQEVSLFE